jgi:hypothetical protein
LEELLKDGDRSLWHGAARALSRIDDAAYTDAVAILSAALDATKDGKDRYDTALLIARLGLEQGSAARKKRAGDVVLPVLEDMVLLDVRAGEAKELMDAYRMPGGATIPAMDELGF